MSFKDTLDKLELPADVAQLIGKTTLVWQKHSAGFDFFSFVNKESKPVFIGDDADYLMLFMQVAERIFLKKKDKTTVFLCICSADGEALLIKPFEDLEKEKFKYSYIAISQAMKQIPDDDRPAQLSFFSEISFQNVNNRRFEKESQKVAKMLKGENKDDWMVIQENNYDFLKTDMYVFHLLRLHSWGFQAVKPGDEIDSRKSMVRPIKPKPRGVIRKERSWRK